MRRLLRRVGTRTGISLGLILAIAAVLVVARLVDDQRASSPFPRQPDPVVPSVPASEGDDGPITDPTASRTDDAAVLAAATEFTTAWLRRTLPAGEWLDGLRPYATDALIQRLAGVDPLGVPAEAAAGTPTIRERSDVHADVLVPIGRGDALALGLVLDDDRWLVGTLGRETG